MDFDTKISKYNTEKIFDRFIWTFSFFTLLLNFICKTAPIKEFSSLFLDDLLINEIYNQIIKHVFNQRYLDKLVLSMIVNTNKNSITKLLKVIEDLIWSQIKTNVEHIHHCMLSSVIYEVIDILIRLSKKLKDIIVSEQASDKTFDWYIEFMQTMIRILK